MQPTPGMSTYSRILQLWYESVQLTDYHAILDEWFEMRMQTSIKPNFIFTEISTDENFYCGEGMAKDNVEPILQWRKIVGDKSSKGMPWRSGTERASDENCSNDGFSSHEKMKEADHLHRKEELSPNFHCDALPTKREVVYKMAAEKKCHITQTKKTKYSHLLSSQQHVMPKEEDICPLVYKSAGKEQGRKEVAALWLQQFTDVDEF